MLCSASNRMILCAPAVPNWSTLGINKRLARSDDFGWGPPATSLSGERGRAVRRPLGLGASAAVVMLIVGGYLTYRSFRPPAGRMGRERQDWQDAGAHSDWSP